MVRKGFQDGVVEPKARKALTPERMEHPVGVTSHS